MTNVSLLKDTIDKKGVRYSFLAERLDMSRQALYNKLSNGSDFKAWQMFVLVDILHLSNEESRAIFFANEVDKMPT